MVIAFVKHSFTDNALYCTTPLFTAEKDCMIRKLEMSLASTNIARWLVVKGEDKFDPHITDINSDTIYTMGVMNGYNVLNVKMEKTMKLKQGEKLSLVTHAKNGCEITGMVNFIIGIVKNVKKRKLTEEEKGMKQDEGC